MGESKGETGFHRRVGASSFNQTWDYLEKSRKTKEEEQEMLHLAHASRYHWGIVGTARNRAVGDWLLSRVYADIGQSGLSLSFARSALVACRKNRLVDIEHTANEAMARAYAVSGDTNKAKKYIETARRQLDGLDLSKEDRRVYSDQIRQTARLIEGR